MRIIAVRSYLRCLRSRIRRLSPDIVDLLLPECERALAALEASLNEPNDADIVREQLLESVNVDVRRIDQVHPWGATVAREPLVECELPAARLEIPIETDLLPHCLSGVATQNCTSLDLDFHLIRITRETSSRVAVYGVSVNAIRTIPDALNV